MFYMLSINQKNLHESMSKLIYIFLINTLFFLKTSMDLAKMKMKHMSWVLVPA